MRDRVRIFQDFLVSYSAFDKPPSRLRGQGRGRPDSDRKRRDLRPIVTVFGAGIAGMSAAHELIERGFDVQVVEPSGSPNDEYEVEVGGLARNQFGRVPENPRLLHASSKDDADTFRRRLELVSELRSGEMQPVQPRFPMPWRILFRPGCKEIEDNLTDEWGISNAVKLRAARKTIRLANDTYGRPFKERLKEHQSIPRPMERAPLDDAWLARESLLVEVRGHTSDDRSELANRKLSCRRAINVIEYLCGLNAPDGDPLKRASFRKHFKAIGVGSLEPLGDQRDVRWRLNSNRVEFRVVEQLIPGEHGYRFFPAFYRHLFDVMRRTPILDRNGHATGDTAYDLLVPTSDLGLALGDGLPPEIVETRRVRSVEELRKLSRLFLGRLGVTQRDIVRFQSRLLKFLTSSSARRQREYERQSWWTFLGGDDERGYSPQMKHYLMETSQALVAMNAEETDARSQGNIVAQLQLHYLGDRSDFTLNGPTSEVWLRPWKEYLTRQGVRFFKGELGGLTWQQDARGNLELIPVTTRHIGWLSAAPRPEELKRLRSPEVMITKPTRRAVVIEVLGNDDGDYMVALEGDRFTAHGPTHVSERWYTFSARGCTREQIAEGLRAKLTGEKDLLVSVHANRTRLILRAHESVQVDLNSGTFAFDDFDAGQKAVSRRLVFSKSAPREKILARLKKYDDDLKAHDKQRAELLNLAVAGDMGTVSPEETPPELELDEDEWTEAGRLRQLDQDFDHTLRGYEEQWQREVVPCFKLSDDESRLEVRPSTWAKKTFASETDSILKGEVPGDVRLLCPYHFRIRVAAESALPPRASSPSDAAHQLPKQEAGAPTDDNSAPYQQDCRDDIADPYGDPKTRTTAAPITVRVRNDHNNLGVVDDPVPEDPRHNFLSHSEVPAAFRPDFYVLALPFTEASRIVWRAELEQPGRLHGCLAEILAFDQRSGRRTSAGLPVRLIRDANGRPPLQHPLRDFSGVQYYFRNQVRIGRGHLYYPRAEWGLSSISQLAYWRERISPAGPFVGQLSVDIGEFYKPSPVRLGNRIGRSAWNSSSRDIAEEVWFQIRQSLERERAGILAPPSFYNLDQRLSFGEPRLASFRGPVTINVADAAAADAAVADAPVADVPGVLTVWVNDVTFQTAAGLSPRDIARSLSKAITDAAFGSVEASPDPNDTSFTVKSTIAEDAALIIVTGHDVGRFEIALGDKRYEYICAPVEPRPPAGSHTAETVRNGLFRALVDDPDVAAIPSLSGQTGIVLSPRGATLPRITVRHDRQQLDVLHGPTVRIRLEQLGSVLSFAQPNEATIAANDTPFLINVPGQWQYRPGLFQPNQLTFQETVLRPAEDERIRYRISNRRWVSAGTYMATTTQLTTMESANESARHAVNAILRCLAARAGDEYNSQGIVFADLATIWDPEKHELDDLEPLKRLDEKLTAEGLPHVMDILKITEAIDAMPMHGKPSEDPIANILHLFQHVVDGSDKDWAFAKQALSDFLAQGVERAREGMDPLGLLRDLQNGSSGILERLRQLLQHLTTKPPSGGKSSGAGTP